tara:strand:- start:2296 stop:3255 length:960 start_codon:yes stop_codon:yes gene_type:complete
LISLLILAFNEEERIREVILEYVELFDEIIIVNDGSKDTTQEIIESTIDQYKKKKIKLVNNKNNLGAGKSFEAGVKEFLKSKSNFLIKIDGDNQFLIKDVKKIIKISNDLEVDYVKGDRFWEHGVKGSIPMIRYIGNAFASLLIKLSTGNWKINDPLNGLMAFSRRALKNLKIPKLFKRYGYPFYLCVYISKLNLLNDLKIIQIKNTISYDNQKSNLKPLSMFFKLIIFTSISYFSKIKIKFKNSTLQMSALLDIVFLFFYSLFLYSFVTFIRVRYFVFRGDESNWFVVMIIFLFMSVFAFTSSQRAENQLHLRKFEDI